MKNGQRMDHWVVFGMLARASSYHARTDYQRGVRTLGSRVRKWLDQGVGAMEQELRKDIVSGMALPQTGHMTEIERIVQDPHWPFPPSPIPKS